MDIRTQRSSFSYLRVKFYYPFSIRVYRIRLSELIRISTIFYHISIFAEDSEVIPDLRSNQGVETRLTLRF